MLYLFNSSAADEHMGSFILSFTLHLFFHPSFLLPVLFCFSINNSAQSTTLYTYIFVYFGAYFYWVKFLIT